MLTEELRQILERRSKLHPNDDFQTEKAWEEETELLSRNMEDTIQFLENECTADEFSWIAEVFDEVVSRTQSKDFIQALYRVVKKFPEECETYHILDSIHFAESYLK